MKFNLNMSNGRPLSYIEGGEYNKDIVYLGDDENADVKKLDVDDISILIENLYKNMNGRINFRMLEELQESILDKKRPTNLSLRKYYDHAMKILEKSKGREIILKDGHMKTMFDTTKERQVFMVSGMSGSGKSSYTGQLINTYKKIYPNNEVFVFSNKDEDPALDKEDIKRMEINDDMINDPIGLDELTHSLVIFDDVECNPDKKINEEMDRIRDLILQQGRSYKISFVYITHLANNYKQTRLILNECNSITIFPAMTTKYALKYLLEKYFGFTSKDIDKLITLPSRWVTIKKAPITVIYDKGCYLL